MVIYKSVEGTKLYLAPTGRLDAASSPELESEFDKSLDDASELVLDLKDLEYISSAGLRTILKAHRAMDSKGGMKITGANALIREVFEITGFSYIFNVE